MNLYRCVNPDCRPTNTASGFDFEAEKAVCPKCHLSGGNVAQRSRVHLIQPEAKGPIVGMFGKRFACVCQPTKAACQPGEQFSGERLAVTCSECLSHAPTEVVIPTPAENPGG